MRLTNKSTPPHGSIAGAFLLLVSCLAAGPASTESLRILGLFPHPGVSHFHFFHPIMRELAVQGHNVTVVSHFPDAKPVPGYKDLPLTGISALTNSVDLDWFANRNKYVGHFLEFFMLWNWGVESCENAYNSTAMRKVLATKKPYDLIIMEQFNSDCMMGVAWKLQAPVIGLSSCALMPWHYDRVGVPHIPSYIPALFMGGSEKMNFGHRVANWFAVHLMNLLKNQFMDRSSDRIIRQYLGPNVPPTSELAKRTSILFVNQHYSLSGVKPLPAGVIEMGGIHIGEPKPLEESLRKYLDASEHGVIYVSWGSMIRSESLPQDKREGLLKAFGQFKQNVIWKWENDTLPNKPANVLIRKWMPQKELLCHPKVRVFVTHGGLMGSSEAAHCGVAVVVTPMYGDQFLNAAALSARGMGRIVHYEDLTAKTVADAIRFALEPSTQEAARKVQYSFRNRQQTALQSAVWWTEHVAATAGAPLIRSHATNMGVFAYHSVDVWAFLVAAVLAFVGSWVWVLRKVLARRSAGSAELKSKAKTN